MAIHQLLIDAIKNRKVLQVSYDGQRRIIEPHCYGIGTSGNNLLRCFQSSGGSNSGKYVDWKLMLTEKILDLSVSNDVFSSARNGYRRGDRAMRHIYAEL